METIGDGESWCADDTKAPSEANNRSFCEIAYMAVTNLVKDQEDHAVRIAQFAIEAIAAANETIIDPEDESKGFVNIRVGMFSASWHSIDQCV